MTRKPAAPGKRRLEELRAQASQDPHLARELQALAHLIGDEESRRLSPGVRSGIAHDDRGSSPKPAREG